MKDRVIKESQCYSCINAYNSQTIIRGCRIFGIRPKKYVQAQSERKCPYKVNEHKTTK